MYKKTFKTSVNNAQSMTTSNFFRKKMNKGMLRIAWTSFTFKTILKTY